MLAAKLITYQVYETVIQETEVCKTAPQSILLENFSVLRGKYRRNSPKIS